MQQKNGMPNNICYENNESSSAGAAEAATAIELQQPEKQQLEAKLNNNGNERMVLVAGGCWLAGWLLANNVHHKPSEETENLRLDPMIRFNNNRVGKAKLNT